MPSEILLEGQTYAKFDYLVAGPPVAAVTCMTCGATMLLNAAFDVQRIHDEWHERLERLWVVLGPAAR